MIIEMIILISRHVRFVSLIKRASVVKLPIKAAMIRRLILVFHFRIMLTAIRRKRSITRFKSNTKSTYTFIF